MLTFHLSLDDARIVVRTLKTGHYALLREYIRNRENIDAMTLQAHEAGITQAKTGQEELDSIERVGCAFEAAIEAAGERSQLDESEVNDKELFGV